MPSNALKKDLGIVHNNMELDMEMQLLCIELSRRDGLARGTWAVNGFCCRFEQGKKFCSK